MALIRLFGRGKSGKSGAGARSGVGAVDAVDISAALADLTTASLSATWRCRHASGVSLAEGSVNFADRSSQAVVIRGKHTYEYVRQRSSVLRSEVLDEALVVKNAAEAEEPQVEEGDDLEDPDGELDETGLEAAALDDTGEEADADDEAEGEVGEEDEESEPEASADGDESDDDDEEPGADEDDGEAAEGDDDSDAEAEADAEADEDEDESEEDDDDADGDEGENEDADGLTAEAESGASAEEKPKAAAPARPAWNYFSDGDACGPHAYAEPDVLAKAALSAGAAQIGKPEEFNGVLHNAYTVTLKPKPTDSDKALARLARQLRDHGANLIVVTAFTNPDAGLDEDDDTDDDDELDLEGESDDDVEEYEDFDDVVAAGGLGHDDEDGEDGGRRKPADPAKRIVRLRIELPHWTPADDPGADHSVRIDLFDLGEPVQIESPGRSNATRRTLRTCADLALF